MLSFIYYVEIEIFPEVALIFFIHAHVALGEFPENLHVEKLKVSSAKKHVVKSQCE